MKSIRSRHLCSFCCRDVGETEFLVRSSIGGLPPSVCSVCVEFFGEILVAYRKSPTEAAVMVEASNRVAATMPLALAGAGR